MPKDVTDENFQSDVIDASNSKPVLVDFFATWCGPCQALLPTIEELSSEMGDKAEITKLNIENAMQTAQKYNVMSVPTVLVFKDETVVENFNGIPSKEALKESIEKHV